MSDPFASLTQDLPAPPPNTLTLYVEVREQDVHLLDAVLKFCDGLAHVRRDFAMIDGIRYYRVLVPPGFLDETMQIVSQLSASVPIGKTFVM